MAKPKKKKKRSKGIYRKPSSAAILKQIHRAAFYGDENLSDSDRFDDIVGILGGQPR